MSELRAGEVAAGGSGAVDGVDHRYLARRNRQGPTETVMLVESSAPEDEQKRVH